MAVIPLIKIFSIIIMLIFLVRIKLNLTLAIFICAVFTIVLFGMPLRATIMSSWNTLMEAKTIQLFIVITMVLYIGSVLKERQMTKKLIDSLSGFLKDKRWVAIIGPALMGFLPSPGGALLSAPMVEEATRDKKIETEFLTFINYWFRHVWEFIWPIYAGLLIFQRLSHIPLKKIILYQCPFTILNILTGFVVVCLFLKKKKLWVKWPSVSNQEKSNGRLFIMSVWPILLIMVLFFVFSLSLHLALIITALVLTLIARIRLMEFIKLMVSKNIIQPLILLAGVMIFQNVISTANAFGHVQGIKISLLAVISLIFFISFSMGFLTGVNTAYIVIAYPILYPFIALFPHIQLLSIYIYIIGFAGVLFSPVHLCLVLTNQYFKSSLPGVYRFLTIPIFVLCLAVTLLVLLW